MITIQRKVSRDSSYYSSLAIIWLLGVMMLSAVIVSGCAGKKPEPDLLSAYQQKLASQGPLDRAGTDGLDLLTEQPQPQMPPLDVTVDPATGRQKANLSIEEALVRALSNSPDIRVLSYDPAIAAEELTKAKGQFDAAVFGSYSYEEQDNPQDSVFLGGQSTSRIYEAGVKQKNTLGTELSASYALVRAWDDLTTRVLPDRFEPVLVFELRQPLLKGGWDDYNKAGINIASLNQKISMAAFHQNTDDIATQVVTAYWMLFQAQKDVEIQQFLFDRTAETLERVKMRGGIDVTPAQVGQVETYLQLRESALLDAKKAMSDAQDALIQLVSDPQLGLPGDVELVLTSEPSAEPLQLDQNTLLAEAMASNPRIQQAKLGVEVAEINVKVAKNASLPRIDLVASSRMNGLDRYYGAANEQLRDGDYVSWTLGATFEYPLGNRSAEAELRRRKLELSKARDIVYRTSDRVALETKEKIRLLEKAWRNVDIQNKAVESANTYLTGLEDMEKIRPSLTPEFLLVKLQAQESLANAQRSEAQAISDFNSAIVQLARATGTVMQMQRVRGSLESAAGLAVEPKQ